MTAKKRMLIAVVVLIFTLASAGQAQINISGSWSSSDGTIGNLTVSQNGSDVSITYTHNNGKVAGSLQGNTFDGYWVQTSAGRGCPKTRGGSVFWGRMHFVFNADAYTGAWGYCDDSPSNAFQGNRTGAGPGQAGVTANPGGPTQIILNNWNGGACGFTDNAVMNLPQASYVESVQLWYNWAAGETSVPYTCSGRGATIRQGELRRGNCDPYQSAWCEATDTLRMMLPAGSYTFHTSVAHVCQNSGSQGAGFIHVQGRFLRIEEIGVSHLATPQVQPTPTNGPSHVDVNGLWKSGDQTFIFFEEGQSIVAMDTYRSNGQIVVWHGEGTISGNHVCYRLHHTRDTLPQAQDGVHDFTVSADGKTMTGTWGTVSNPVMGNWALQRVGP